MSPETGLGGPGARAEPDLVRLHLTDSALVIDPGGGELREDLVRPALPVDGGEIVCDPGIGGPAGAGLMSARLLDGRVPEWVSLIYGPEVARTAEQMLDRTAGPESDGAGGLARVRRTGFTRPSRTAGMVQRRAQGLGVRRYWPSPADGSALAIDPFLLDLELGALMRMEPVPVCFGSDAMESLVYGPHRDRIRGAAEYLRDHGAKDVLVRKLHVLLRRALSWLIERIEDDEDDGGDDGDGPGAEAEADALRALYDDLGGLPRPVEQFYSATLMRADSRKSGARRARVQPESVWEGGPLVRRGTDTPDWSQNFCGLLATDDDAVQWVVAPVRGGGFRLDVSVAVADRVAHDSDGARALARVPIPGFLPVLVELKPDEVGARLTGWAAVTADEARAIDVVDVVSVPGARAPLRGPARERMRGLQGRATRWARRRSRSVQRQVEAPGAQSWDLLVPRTIPAGLDLSMPWAAEVAAVAGVVMRP